MEPVKKVKVAAPSLPKRKIKSAESVEELESQLTSMAYELAKKQLEEGTISSQNLNFFLQLGSTREKLEREMLELQKSYTEAKRDNVKSAAQTDELYSRAIEAMSRYSGHYGNDEEEDYEAYIR